MKDIKDKAPGAKKKWRSGRERKPVSYLVEEDLDWSERKTGRKAARRKDMSNSPARSGRGKTTSKPDPAPTLPSSSRTLRTQEAYRLF